jgi:1-deoxy-D-xylulose-5-phosphate reductoisomerase
MRVPIAYALTHPEREDVGADRYAVGGSSLDFEPPDLDAFPCLRLGYEAGRLGGSATTALNAADEVAVHAFLERRIGFSSIAVVVERTLADVDHIDPATVEDVMAADRQARAIAAGHVGVC